VYAQRVEIRNQRHLHLLGGLGALPARYRKRRDAGDRTMIWIVVGILALAVLWCAVMLENWIDRGDVR